MQFVGCDVAKATLDAAAERADGRITVKQFANRRSGFNQLLKWMAACYGDPPEEICLILEATGVYHLPLAAYLTEHGIKVLIANPGRARAFANSQNQLNKNDQIDARTLQRYGRSLDLSRQHFFVPDSKEISGLKALLSRQTQLEKDHQREQNRLEKCTFIPQSAQLAASIRRGIRRLKTELERIDKRIDDLISADTDLQRNNELLCSIKGIGEKTARWLLPLLHQQRFTSARELAAFLGVTPCHQSSGTQHKPGQLSGRGSKLIRAKLYFPSIVAATRDPALRGFYQARLKNGATKMQAIIAVMRKLLHIAFGVIKHQQPYDPEYAA